MNDFTEDCVLTLDNQAMYYKHTFKSVVFVQNPDGWAAFYNCEFIDCDLTGIEYGRVQDSRLVHCHIPNLGPNVIRS